MRFHRTRLPPPQGVTCVRLEVEGLPTTCMCTATSGTGSWPDARPSLKPVRQPMPVCHRGQTAHTPTGERSTQHPQGMPLPNSPAVRTRSLPCFTRTNPAPRTRPKGSVGSTGCGPEAVGMARRRCMYPRTSSIVLNSPESLQTRMWTLKRCHRLRSPRQPNPRAPPRVSRTSLTSSPRWERMTCRTSAWTSFTATRCCPRVSASVGRRK
mmetsp:Transcript_34638/g.75710  ORF Transcript_34638/g.75710 Transcript_34638/m.75710 type:complete len:210 (+) Transcript_34638:767-1396(+)